MKGASSCTTDHCCRKPCSLSTCTVVTVDAALDHISSCIKHNLRCKPIRQAPVAAPATMLLAALSSQRRSRLNSWHTGFTEDISSTMACLTRYMVNSVFSYDQYLWQSLPAKPPMQIMKLDAVPNECRTKDFCCRTDNMLPVTVPSTPAIACLHACMSVVREIQLLCNLANHLQLPAWI